MEHTRIQERLCGIAGVSGSWLSKENRIGVMVHSGRPEVITRCQKKEEARFVLKGVKLAKFGLFEIFTLCSILILSNRVYEVPSILPALIVNHVPNLTGYLVVSFHMFFVDFFVLLFVY